MINETYSIIGTILSGKCFKCLNCFFDHEYECYICDDDLIASKANDVELITLSDKKEGDENQQLTAYVILSFRLSLECVYELQKTPSKET